VLARRNRIVDADDFRRVVRRGEKVTTKSVIGYRVAADTARVGIIVTAKSGNAVVRNSLRRRARAIARSLINAGTLSGDIVFRFRAEGAVPGFADIDDDIRGCAKEWNSA
jgi:ribonuclease P protein component